MFILGISVRHQVDACNTYVVLLLASWHAIWYTLLRSQPKTKRCHGDVLGDESVESVQAGNCMIWRVVALLLVCSAKGVFWILEQPERSLMENHPAVRHDQNLSCTSEHGGLRRKIKKTDMVVHECLDRSSPCIPWPLMFAVSEGIVCCCSDRKILEKLPQFKPSADDLPAEELKRGWEMTVRYTDDQGRQRVNGGKNLKGSQAYPRQWGSQLSCSKRNFGIGPTTPNPLNVVSNQGSVLH